MSKKFRIIVIISISIIIFIVVFFIIFSYDLKHKNKIEKVMQGVILNKDTCEVLDEVTVTVNGYLNKDSMATFRGELYLSNIEHTQSDNALLTYSVGFGDDGWKKRGNILYPIFIWREGKLVPYHAMVYWVEMDMDFSYLVLTNYEESIYHDTQDTELIFNGTDIIVFPANDAESALKILEEHQIDREIFEKKTIMDYKPVYESQ